MEEKKKKRPLGGSHGAITLFLIILLVPCLTFVCIFGDLARVELSKSQAEAAADLALYSLMSNYDEKLKEWYGLVASVQNIDEFYDVTEQYFSGMLSSLGDDEFASGKFSSYISALRNNKGMSDFLQIDKMEGLNVGPVSNGAMGGNAALIEDGIVEFMKYRGPVAIVQRVINRFKNGGAGDLADAEENEPIQKKREEAAKAEGEMIKELVHTYMALLSICYHFEDNASIMTFDNMKESVQRLQWAQEDMKQINQMIARYYSFTSDSKGNCNIDDLTGYFVNLPGLPEFDEKDGKTLTDDVIYRLVSGGNKSHVTMDKIGAKKEDDESYSMTAGKLEDLVKDVKKVMDSIKQAGNAVTNSDAASIPAPGSGWNNQNEYNAAVYLLKMGKALDRSNLKTIQDNREKLLTSYAKVMLALNCSLPKKVKETDPDWKKDLEQLQKDLESVYNNYLTYKDGSSEFDKLLKKYAGAMSFHDAIHNHSVTFVSEYTNRAHSQNNVTMAEFFKYLRDDIGVLYEAAKKQSENLNVAINGGKTNYQGKDYDVVSLSQLKSVMREAKDKRNDWGNEAHSHDTDYAKEEQADYDSPSKQGKFSGQLPKDTDKAVEEIKTRLTNMKKIYDDFIAAVEKFTYGDKVVVTMTPEDAIAAALKVMPTSVDQVSDKYAENDKAAEGYLKQLLKPGSNIEYNPPTINNAADGNNPNLRNDPKPELFQYLLNTLDENKLGEAVDKADANQKKLDKLKEQGEEQKKNAGKFDQRFTKEIGSDLVDISKTSGEYSIGKALKSVIGIVKTLISGDFSSIRDQIYFVEYVLDMFSYSTRDNEGQYNFAVADGQQVGLVNYMANGYSYGEKYEKLWKTYDPTKFTGNISLTNRPINKDNNQAHLAEIEYILYGKDTNKKNLSEAYTSIYGLRFLLDLPAGFQHFFTPKESTGAMIESIADAIATATLGIIIPPITKAIIIGVLAVLEALYDLSCLKAGLQVPLYKMKIAQWVIKIPGAGDKLTGDADSKIDQGFAKIGEAFNEDNSKKNTPSEGLFYSDYITLFLLMSCQDKGLYESMLIRAGDLIQNNMVKGGEEGFDLSKSHVYFKISGNLSVKPLLLNLSILDSFNPDNAITEFRENPTWAGYSISMIRGYS